MIDHSNLSPFTLAVLKPELKTAFNNISKLIPIGSLQSQKEISDKLDQYSLDCLMLNYPEEVARLKAVSRPHAAAWLTAPPNRAMGTWMEDIEFIISTKRWLGVKVTPSTDSKCLDCHIQLTPKASHTSHCLRKGDIIIRHNHLSCQY